MKVPHFLQKIINFGIKPGFSSDVIEKMQLLNVISFLGVPICFSYVILFVITSHYFHTVVFLLVALGFIIPLLLNAWKGLKIAIPVLTISAPVFWAFITIIMGKETGFYFGFMVMCIPPMLFYPSLKKSLISVGPCLIMFFLSIIGLRIFPPVETFSFAMTLFVINLFTVLITILFIVYFFKSQLNESRAKVKEKNREIVDSINYAKRIQNAMLPSEVFFQRNFNQYFIHYTPKDIVAGDFYWMEEMDDKILLAAADCTGHGVPGALVSLVCYNALNKAVLENKLSDPGQILDLTRKFVVEHFSKTDEKVKDGMDISLVSIDKETKKIAWAGANNPLWYIQNNELKAILSNKQPIGIAEKAIPFTSHQIQLSVNDCIYLFTDGYADQFGGNKGKKFMYKQLKELLLANSHISMVEQKKVLKDTIENWKGSLEQVDDILVIGIRI